MTIYEVEISPDLKAKYINDGYQSCLREVKARVGSVNDRFVSTDFRDDADNRFSRGYNDCLDEIKKLINEI